MTLAMTANSQTLRNAFVQMPDSIMPLLTSVNRQDGMDYVDNNMSIDVTNKLGRITTISGEKDKYIDISTTKTWTKIMTLPTATEDTIICMVKTIHIDTLSDSQIRFYSKQWEVLKSEDYINMPTINDFITPNDSITEDKRKEIANKIDIPLIEATLMTKDDNEQSNKYILTFKMHSPAYMNEKDRLATSPYIKKEIRMQWDGNRFIP